MTVDAIVLAGARNAGSLRTCSPADYEAEIEVAGVPMVRYVVKALRDVPTVDRIVVVGPKDSLVSNLEGIRCIVEDGGETMMDSLARGMAALGAGNAVLVLTSDIPLITPEALTDFIGRCQTRPAEVYYSVVAREVNENAYPGVQRTYVKLRDGVYTGGNVVLLNRPGIVTEFRGVLSQAIAFRKHPVQMCRMLGLMFLVRLLLGRLSIADIERRVGRLLNLNGACVISPYPEIGIDVDKPSDFELVEKALSGSKKTLEEGSH